MNGVEKNAKILWFIVKPNPSAWRLRINVDLVINLKKEERMLKKLLFESFHFICLHEKRDYKAGLDIYICARARVFRIFFLKKNNIIIISFGWYEIWKKMSRMKCDSYSNNKKNKIIKNVFICLWLNKEENFCLSCKRLKKFPFLYQTKKICRKNHLYL